MAIRNSYGSLFRRAVRGLRPTQRMIWTREGCGYVLVSLGLLATGIYQQINLILLVAGLAAGPVVASFVVSRAMLRRLQVSRRAPAYVFSEARLVVDYTLQNGRAWTAALALFVEDDVAPTDRSLAGGHVPAPRLFFARVPPMGVSRMRWEGVGPSRGRYRFRSMDIATRSPFGLLERRVTVADSAQLVVYPKVGQLSRRWQLIQRQATETTTGQRHDRSAQQQEYHGLRDYRPGDSPRWIHWRTSARIGKPMIKEFEQQNEQDLAILLDPWLPRSKVTPEQREALEESIRFAATVCLETCRQQGRRLLLGWTSPTPGLRQGPASIKLLHELLEQLAVMRPSIEGTLADLFDALPPATLREANIVVVSTRPVNLLEEADRSARLSGTAARWLPGRVVLLDASRGDLSELVQYTEIPSTEPVGRNLASLASWDLAQGRDDRPQPEDVGRAGPPGVHWDGGEL